MQITVRRWALVYWPQLSAEFRFASGLDAAQPTNFWAAVYVSSVTLATLGYGDITPTAR